MIPRRGDRVRWWQAPVLVVWGLLRLAWDVVRGRGWGGENR